MVVPRFQSYIDGRMSWTENAMCNAKVTKKLDCELMGWRNMLHTTAVSTNCESTKIPQAVKWRNDANTVLGRLAYLEPAKFD